MRLLQLATGPEELLDLHPHITVVTGLDEDGRRLLHATVRGLASGEAVGSRGLLEAHGVLFDLSPEMLALLQIGGDDLHPVVSLSDLPIAPLSSGAAGAAAQRALVQAEARYADASETNDRARATAASATEALSRARQALDAEADAAGRIGSVDDLTADLDRAIEERRRLDDARSELIPQVERVEGERAAMEAAAAEAREAHRQAATRCSELAAQLDEAAMALDPEAAAAVAQSERDLVVAQEETAAERLAEQTAEEPSDGAPLAERLASVEADLEEVAKRLAAFGPADRYGVSDALAGARSVADEAQVPSPAALELADELAATDAVAQASAGAHGRPGALAEARARLDDAQQALLEAEQAARNPVLDRATVDRLEDAHAQLLDAIDKADGRFGGTRAQRRVDTARAAEQVVLDELGFTSYSDYMMGYSLLHVDPAEEARLDDARSGLSEAEDAWSALQAQTDLELARAEAMERRRLVVARARALLARPVPTEELVEELRQMRVPAPLAVAASVRLRASLDEVGLGLGDEALDPDDLVLIAEAWMDEADAAVEREAELRQELRSLGDERDSIVVALEVAARAAAEAGPPPEEQRAARVAAAVEAVRVAEERARIHAASESTVAALTRDLAGAAEAERLASAAADEAEAALAGVADVAEGLAADLRRIEDGLAKAWRAEGASNDRLRALSDPGHAPTHDDLVEACARAEAALEVARRQVDESATALASAEQERRAAMSEAPGEGDPAEVDHAVLVDEVEWYLLARLAAQRSVSLAGSTPLVLDGALSGLDDVDLDQVLGRLERMAEAVQVIVIDDRGSAVAWARLAGAERAAVVSPQPG